MTLVPVEEYLAASYSPDREYVDGRIVERNVGEYDHSRLQTLIAAALAALEAAHAIRVFVEQRVRVLDTAERKRYRIPDVCVMRVPYARTPVLMEPPLLVVEVLSPDDAMTGVLARLGDYLHFGVERIYLADPVQRALFRYDAEGLHTVQPRVLAAGAVVRLDLEPVFARLDE